MEQQANFTDELACQENTYCPPSAGERLREEVRMRKLIRLPSKALNHQFGHNAVLDSGATSSFIKPDGRALPVRQPSTKTVRMPNGQTLKTSFKALLPNKNLP